MTRSIQTHLRVVGAVTMRDINSQQASLMYGYAWALVDVGIAVLGILVMKLVLRAFSPPGMPPATFVLTGAVPWFMFQHLYGQAPGAVQKGRSLLSLPIVTQLDLVMAGAIQTGVTYTIAFVVATTISSVLEQVAFPRFPLGIMLLLLASWVIGTSFGMILLLLNHVYPPANKFISLVLRFGLFLSGVFIPLTRFPSYVWPYLTWNPMLHVEELLRQYWFYSYVSPVGNPYVIIEWAVGLTTFGLICERYVRTRFLVA